jgi:hypothetical protein
MKSFGLHRLIVCAFVLAMFANAQDSKPEPAASESDIAVPTGQPLAEGEVIILLQAKVPLDLIQKFVAARGVNFISSKETSKRILASGGSVALIGTINLNQKDDAVLPVSTDKDKKKK